MKPSLQSIIHDSNEDLTYQNEQGELFLAIKPMCDILEIDYIAVHKSLISDKHLSQHLEYHKFIAADGKRRKMLCLVEEYFWGWLLTIQSKSEVVTQYKRECYQLLYERFSPNSLTNKKNMPKHLQN